MSAISTIRNCNVKQSDPIWLAVIFNVIYSLNTPAYTFFVSGPKHKFQLIFMKGKDPTIIGVFIETDFTISYD